MTTPGAVSGPPTVPVKAAVGPVRDSGAKGDNAASPGEGDEGFGDVLSKLQGKDDTHAEETAPRKGGARPGERANMQLREIEAQLAADASSGDPSVDVDVAADASAADAPPDAAASGQVGVPAVNGQATDASIVNDLAALVGVDRGQQPAAPAGPSTEQQAATRSAVDERPMSADARLALQAEAAAKGQPDGVDAGRIAASADPTLARVGSRASNVDKDQADKSLNAVSDDPSPPQPGIAPTTQPAEPSSATQYKANVVRQETHFAPVAPAAGGPSASKPADEGSKSSTGPEAVAKEPAAASPVEATQPSFAGSSSLGTSPAQQIADRIATEAAGAPQATDRAGSAPEQQGAKPALRMLQIQLQPSDLGTVTVRMELKEAELTLHVAADRKDTAELIRSDQDTLSKLLRSAGYNIDTGSIRVVDGDRTLASQQSGQAGAQTNQQSSPQSQPQSQSGTSERHGHAQRGDGGASSGDTGPQTGRNETHETTTNRAGLGVYI